MADGTQLVVAGVGAVLAGMVNALAGGGTLITFPILVALGLPAASASVTSTVALCPGYLGGTLAQSADLAGQRSRMLAAVPASILGGVVGGVLLVATGNRLFRDLVPWLIIAGSLLLAAQEPLRRMLIRRGAPAEAGGHRRLEPLVALPIALAAVYGGYFGAGLGVILLAVLGLLLDDTLPRLNALKQFLSLVTNTAAALFFLTSDFVVWPVAAVMAVGALAGGVIGGRLTGIIPPSALRALVVVTGLVVGLVYLLGR